MSIINLLKQNGMPLFPSNDTSKESNNNIMDDNNKLYNPAIPGDLSSTNKNIKSKEYDKLKGQKHYIIFNNQRFDKLRSKPLNGDFLRMKYDTNYGEKVYNQQLEGTIDPNNKMKRINPLRVPAYDYINGAEGMDFRTLPSSVFMSHDSTQLVAKAEQSYSSRLVSLGELPSLQINNGLITPVVH